MSQGSLNVPTSGPVTPTAYSGDINTAMDAVISKNSGAGTPNNFPTVGAGTATFMDWADTTDANNPILKINDGGAFVPVGTIDAVAHIWKSVVGGGYGSLASGATTDLGTKPDTLINVTGVVTITSFGSSAQVGVIKVLVFASALTITNNANIILPGNTNIVTAANDVAVLGQISAGVWQVFSYRRRVSLSPTVQVLTSGAGATYTTPAGATKLKIREIGGGGGGGGFNSVAGATNGGTGGDTSFNAITAAGGVGGTAVNNSANGAAGGAGGTGGAGSAAVRVAGAKGKPGQTAWVLVGPTATVPYATGFGAASPFGDGGSPANLSSQQPGGSPSANTGAGGSGAYEALGGFGTPGGGGAGEYVEFYINNPSATYTYTVGTAGTAGSAGAGGSNPQPGGAGAAGRIIVEEFYD